MSTRPIWQEVLFDLLQMSVPCWFYTTCFSKFGPRSGPKCNSVRSGSCVYCLVLECCICDWTCHVLYPSAHVYVTQANVCTRCQCVCIPSRPIRSSEDSNSTLLGQFICKWKLSILPTWQDANCLFFLNKKINKCCNNVFAGVRETWIRFWCESWTCIATNEVYQARVSRTP